jgi:hypothetical protein
LIKIASRSFNLLLDQKVKKIVLAFVFVFLIVQTSSSEAFLKSEVENWYVIKGGVRNDSEASNGAFISVNNARAHFRLPQKDEYQVWARISGKGSLLIWFGEDKGNFIEVSSLKWRWISVGKVKGQDAVVNIRSNVGQHAKLDCIGFSNNNKYMPKGLEKRAENITPTGQTLSLKDGFVFGPRDRTHVEIDEHNNLYVNEIAFFPIFFWAHDTHLDTAHGQNIVKRGITAPLDFWNTRAIADKIFLVPARPNSNTPHWKIINQLRIPALRNHPQLLAYFMADEPKGPIDKWRELNELLHKLDPDHPTFIRIPFKPERVRAWKDIADIHGFGQWGPESSIEDVAYVLDFTRMIVEDKKPIWPIFHPWSKGNLKKGVLVDSQTLRCAVFTAIVHGAKGLTFYASRHIPEYDGYWPKDIPLASWEEVAEVYRKTGEIIAQVQSLKNVIFAPYPKQTVQMTNKGGKVHHLLKGVGSIGYLMATNPSPNREVSVTFDLSALSRGCPLAIYDVFEGVTGRGSRIDGDMKKGVLNVIFKPLAVHVYRIESALGLEFMEETREERLERIKHRIKSFKTPQF